MNAVLNTIKYEIHVVGIVVGNVLQNLYETVTKSGKELKFVENEIVEDNFETTHLKLFEKYTGSLSKKTFIINTSGQNLPKWFDNDDFHCNHSGPEK